MRKHDSHVRTDIYRTISSEMRDKGDEASEVAAGLIEAMADELNEAWKVAAAYSDDNDDGDCDRFYERAYLFDQNRHGPIFPTIRTAREWCLIHGGMDGNTATNPEDCSLDLVTEAEYWAKHSNTASA